MNAFNAAQCYADMLELVLKHRLQDPKSRDQIPTVMSVIRTTFDARPAEGVKWCKALADDATISDVPGVAELQQLARANLP